MNPKALQYMLFSAFAFAIMNLMVKYLNDYSTFQLLFFRGLGTFLICTGILLKDKVPLLGTHKKLLIARAVFGTIALALFFYAVKIMPLGSATTLRYLAPVFGVLLAIVFLKEKVKPIQFAFLLLAVIGAALIKGFDSRITLLGLTTILSSAFFLGFVFVLIRKIGDTEHHLVVINYFMMACMIVGFIGMIGSFEMPTSKDLLLLSALGVIGFIGQVYMTKAFQMEETNKVAPLKYMEAVFVVALSFLWFGESYALLAIVGMGLIMVGITLNSLLGNK